MTTEALTAIKEALAAGPTPGPWEVYSENTPDKAAAISEATYQIHHSDPFVGKVFMINASGKCPAFTGCGPTSEVNAAYIAAVSPSAISSLISSYEAMERRVSELEDALKSARSSVRNARGAVESGQVVDKDVHGTLSRVISTIDSALTPTVEKVETPAQGNPAPQAHTTGDLVDLLRAKKTYMSHGRDMVEQQWPASDLEIEAAVEIERLRSYCQQLLDILDNYQVEIEGEDNDLVAMITKHVDPGNATTEGQL